MKHLGIFLILGLFSVIANASDNNETTSSSNVKRTNWGKLYKAEETCELLCFMGKGKLYNECLVSKGNTAKFTIHTNSPKVKK